MKNAKNALATCAACATALILALTLAGCSGNTASQNDKDSQSQEQAQGQSDNEQTQVATYADIEGMDLEYTDRDKDASYDEASTTKITLEGAGASINGAGASVEDSTVSITSEGTYILSGSLENGQVLVDASDDDKLQLVLSEASIHNDNGAAIFVKNADKCFITLAEGTDNTLTDGAEYTFEDNEDEPNATLFSKDDLTINGTGSLNVTGSYKHAIHSKDDLVITGGNFTISSNADALRGKDCVKILDGTFNLKSNEDAVKSSRDDDPVRGFVCIDGGQFNINAGDDAIHGETYLRVTAGDISVDSCNEGLEAMVVSIDDGDIDVTSSDDAMNAAAPSAESADANTSFAKDPGKDTEQGNENCKLLINGGSLALAAQGDALDSNGSLEVNGGNVFVTGPTNSGDGALDYNLSGSCHGGTVLIAGPAGMAQNFSGGSQPFTFAQISGSAGQNVTVTDESGTVLISFAPSADFETVIASCPQFSEGAAYIVNVGDASTTVTASTTLSENIGQAPDGSAPQGQPSDGSMSQGEMPDKDMPQGQAPTGDMPQDKMKGNGGAPPRPTE